jgi:uncharacterized protein involved in outer membrane biogenesis
VFTLAGKLGRSPSLEGSDVKVALRGPELRQFDFLSGAVKLPQGAFEASARVQRTEKGLKVSESQVSLPGVRGRLDADLGLPIERLQLGFDVALEGENAAEFWKDYVEVPLPQATFLVDAKGSVDDASWRIDEARVRLGATEAHLSGAAQRRSENSTFRLRVNSPNIAEPGRWYGIVLPEIGVKLSGTLERTSEALNFKSFTVLTDKGDLAGNLTYTPGNPPRVEGALNAPTLDLRGLLPPSEREQVLAPEPSARARLIPHWQLPMEPLRRLNAKLSIRADSLRLHRENPVTARAELVVEDGALELAPLSLSGEDGDLELELSLIPRGDGTEASLSLLANELYTGFFTTGQEDVDALPRGDWNVQLRSHGNTLRDLAANLNGSGTVKSRGGRVANTRTGSFLFAEFFGTLLRTINPFYESDSHTEIVCSVFPFAFVEGSMRSAPTVVVQTDKLNILSRGTIDLETERLDLSFRTEARRGLGISAGSVVNPLMRIGGTLADPTLDLNAGGALATGTAAFFTGGLSLLAQAAFGAAFRSSDPCGNVLEQSRKYLQ